MGRCGRRPLPQAHRAVGVGADAGGVVDARRRGRRHRRHPVLDAAAGQRRAGGRVRAVPAGAHRVHRRGRRAGPDRAGRDAEPDRAGGDAGDRAGAGRRADRAVVVRRRRRVPARRRDERAGRGRAAGDAAGRASGRVDAIADRRDGRRLPVRAVAPEPRAGGADDDRCGDHRLPVPDVHADAGRRALRRRRRRVRRDGRGGRTGRRPRRHRRAPGGLGGAAAVADDRPVRGRARSVADRAGPGGVVLDGAAGAGRHRGRRAGVPDDHAVADAGAVRRRLPRADAEHGRARLQRVRAGRAAARAAGRRRDAGGDARADGRRGAGGVRRVRPQAGPAPPPHGQRRVRLTAGVGRLPLCAGRRAHIRASDRPSGCGCAQSAIAGCDRSPGQAVQSTPGNVATHCSAMRPAPSRRWTISQVTIERSPVSLLMPLLVARVHTVWPSTTRSSIVVSARDSTRCTSARRPL